MSAVSTEEALPPLEPRSSKVAGSVESSRGTSAGGIAALSPSWLLAPRGEDVMSIDFIRWFHVQGL